AATAWPRSALVMIAAAVRKQQPGFRTRTVLIAVAPCCSQSARKSVKKGCERRLRTPAGRPPPPGLKGIASTPQIECARLPRPPPHRLKNPAEPGGMSQREAHFLSFKICNALGTFREEPARLVISICFIEAIGMP